MIDCSAALVPAQRGVETASSMPASPSTMDEQGQNFSNLVADKSTGDRETISDERQEIDESDKEQDPSLAQERSSAAWMTNWFSLTQIATQAPQSSDATEPFLPTDHKNQATIKAAMLAGVSSGPLEGEDMTSLPHAHELMEKTGKATLAAQNGKIDNKTGRAGSDNMGHKSPLQVDAPIRVTKEAIMTPEQAPLSNLPTNSTNAHQNTSLKESDFAHIGATPQQNVGGKEAGDNIVMKNISSSPAPHNSVMIGSLDAIEVIRSRKQGDLTLLQLQLTPEHLGRIDAKLKLEESRLLVEVRTDNPLTAKLLEKDQHLLAQALERAGFSSETRLSLHIIERGAMPLQAGTAPASALPSGGQTASDQHEFTAQGQAEREQTDAQADSSQGEDKNHDAPRQDNRDKHFVERSSTSSKGYKYGVQSNHRLIV